jgi:hypothetical protein
MVTPGNTPFQMRIQSNIFDLVKYVYRFVLLNKTSVLSCCFILAKSCLLPNPNCRLSVLSPYARHQGVHIISGYGRL